jgi:hypothetical protein
LFWKWKQGGMITIREGKENMEALKGDAKILYQYLISFKKLLMWKKITYLPPAVYIANTALYANFFSSLFIPYLFLIYKLSLIKEHKHLNWHIFHHRMRTTRF